MRRFVLSILSTLALGGSAVAADLAPMYAAPPPTWAGFYVGVNVGGGAGDGRSDYSFGGARIPRINNLMWGAIGGGQVGWNGQMGAIVYGMEADFQASGLGGTLKAPDCPPAACGVLVTASYKQDMPWYGTARGRLGYAMGGWLAYATGGYAYTQLQTRAEARASAVTASASDNQFRNGWTVGAGVEMMITPMISARLEYMYLDFGNQTTSWQAAATPVFTHTSNLTMNVVRAGVNLRF